MSRFGRWSRKKRGVESDEADTELNNCSIGNAEVTPELEQEVDALSATSSDDESLNDETIVDDTTPLPGSLDHTLPDPDHLPAGSDFSGFMSPGVSAALRRRALKRLWATGNYNVRDGLDDYDADYRQQLKPMVSELAGKLRRWTHNTEEARERPAGADDASPITAEAAIPPGDANASKHGANTPKDASLGDQSDSSNSKVDECTKEE